MIVLATTIAFSRFFESWDNAVYDEKLRRFRDTTLSREIVHLDVDDRAIKEFGQWPWDREISGRIVRKLTEYGARLVVFDVLYSSKGMSEEGNLAFFKAIESSQRVVSAVSFTMSALPETPLSSQVDTGQETALYDRSLELHIPAGPKFFKVVRLREANLPLLPILEKSKAVGHISAAADPDGAHRSVPLLVQFEDRYIPSLGLASLMAYLGASPQDVNVDGRGRVHVQSKQGTIVIPTLPQCRMLVNWQSLWKSYPHFSAGDLFKEMDTLFAPRIKDKIVIVAVTWTGASDIGITPLAKETPLSRIHSNALNTMLTGKFIYRWSTTWFTCAMAIIALFFVLLTETRSLRTVLLAALGVMLAYIGLTICVFKFLHWDFPSIAPLTVFGFPVSVVIVLKAMFWESHAARVSRAMERYLSPQMLESIASQYTELDLSTKRRELSVLFADIAGFSTMSETVEVEYLAQFLNEFFDTMTKAVFDNNGAVDKFLGDGILAFFGEPIAVENHAVSAIRAGQQMVREMHALSAKWSASGIKEFAQGTHIRVGITTGVIIVGNIGSERRMEYTVLGSTVNLASRLQSMAPLDGVLVSSRTCALAKGAVSCCSPQHIRVRGFAGDVTVYEIQPDTCEDETLSAELPELEAQAPVTSVKSS